jgi:hypothetical protein
MPAHPRKFRQARAAAAGACARQPADENSESVASNGGAARALRDRLPENVAHDKDLWALVHASPAPPERPVNLMTRGYGTLPMAVRRAVVDFWDKTNEPDCHVWSNSTFWHQAVETASPALFTTTDDLDRFVQALRPILRSAKGNG